MLTSLAWLNRQFKSLIRFYLAGCLLSISVLITATNGVSAEMIAAPVYPYELGYRDASIIVRGNITSYTADQGAVFYVTSVLRGDVKNFQHYRLDGSANYAFLASLPENVTAFISKKNQKALELWHQPTSGGLIWSDIELIEILEQAYINPNTSLSSKNPRMRLAAAYYLTTNAAKLNGIVKSDLTLIIDNAAWGMSQSSANTNQAAVDILNALGLSLQTIGITYHPLFKAELKVQAAAQLRNWWSRKNKELNILD